MPDNQTVQIAKAKGRPLVQPPEQHLVRAIITLAGEIGQQVDAVNRPVFRSFLYRVPDDLLGNRDAGLVGVGPVGTEVGQEAVARRLGPVFQDVEGG